MLQPLLSLSHTEGVKDLLLQNLYDSHSFQFILPTTPVMLEFLCFLQRGKLEMAGSFKAFLNSPVGPKTTHFWGPIANWGFVAAVCFPVVTVKIATLANDLLAYKSVTLRPCEIFYFYFFSLVLLVRGWWTCRNLQK